MVLPHQSGKAADQPNFRTSRAKKRLFAVMAS
jgi:hypothetical protein